MPGGRKNPQTLKGRINGATGIYREGKAHNIAKRGNQFASHKVNYRNLRRPLGLSAG